jgi:single-stranded DNA-specific DHH superfamily exonuclease
MTAYDIMKQMQVIDEHCRKVNDWLDSVARPASRFAIVYHGDCDGVVSGALFDYIFRETMHKADIRHIPVRTEQYDFVHVLEEFDRLRPDITVFLDLSIQNLPDKLNRMAGMTNRGILIYDHHSQQNDRVPENTLYLNPSITPDGYDENAPPPCYFSAKLAESRSKQDFDWVAAVGLIGESAVDRFLDLFTKISQQFPELCPAGGIHSASQVQRSKFRTISYAVGSAFWGPPGQYEQAAFDALTGMIDRYSPQSFFEPGNSDAGQILELERTVRREISRTFHETLANSYYDPATSLRYAEVSSEYRIGGVIATRMSRKFRDDLVVTGQPYDDRYVIEARRGSHRTENMAALLARAARDLHPFSTGGHPAAAGATLSLSSSSEFFLALETALAERA